MRNVLLLIILVLVAACNDGELQIEIIDFDAAPISSCASTPDITTTLFFKINSTEALILDLQSGLLANEVSTDTLSSAIPGQSQLLYRIFSDNVTQAYFCDAIPPSTPTVIEEISAETGQVLIYTSQNAADSTKYDHTFLLSGITLINSQGERITDLKIEDFGTITTSK